MGRWVAPAGAAIALAGLFAHPLGLAATPGWGWKQALLVALGAAATIAGTALARSAPAALWLFVIVSLVVFGLDIRDDPGTNLIGIAGHSDPIVTTWHFAWWPHALTSGENPFVTDAVFAGGGTYNLARTTSMPVVSLAAWPVTALAGPRMAYNVVMLAAPALAAFTAFLLCRYVSGRFWPAVAGGALFGFSPYLVGHMLAHTNQVLVLLVPLVALLILRRADGSLGRGRFVAALGLVLAAQLGITVELAVSMALFTGVGFLVAAVWLPQYRPRLPRLAAETGAAGLLALLVMAPLTYYGLTGGEIVPPEDPIRFSGDLLNLVVPGQMTALGGEHFAETSAQWTGNLEENGFYLGAPLLVLLALGWRRRRAIVVFALVAVVLALGARLHVGGDVTGVPLPWDLLDDLPYVEYALPVRFVLYALLAASVLLALRLASGSRAAWALGAAIAITLVPVVAEDRFRRPAPVPAFYERPDVLAGQRVLLVPDSRSGDGMLHQAVADFSFEMAGGYLGIRPPWHTVERYPVLGELSPGLVSESSAAELRRFLDERRVDAVVLDPVRANDAHRALLSSLGEPRLEDGVEIYPSR